LDEPLSNLDAKLRTEMRSQITQLHNDLQTTFVYVTHDQTEAMTMADRIVVMKDGIIHQVDTPQNLYNHPCNMFVAGFIGSPQMNFIESTITTEDDKKFYASFENYRVPLPLRMFESLESYIGKD
ncbi:MAG: sugar ABC transporter ATP-binding protein, partial [Oscillospiraceae bacterium]